MLWARAWRGTDGKLHAAQPVLQQCALALEPLKVCPAGDCMKLRSMIGWVKGVSSCSELTITVMSLTHALHILAIQLLPYAALGRTFLE